MGRGNAATRQQIELDIEAAISRANRRPVTPPAVPAPAPPPPVAEEVLDDREPFGRWLLAQKSRGDWIDELAAAARRDPGFPKQGSPAQVRQRMEMQGADGDAFEQLEDAESCWRSL